MGWSRQCAGSSSGLLKSVPTGASARGLPWSSARAPSSSALACGSAEDDGVGLSGGFETPHLARIEKSHWIDLGLEAELVGVRALVAAAVLQRDHVRVRHHDPVRLVK